MCTYSVIFDKERGISEYIMNIFWGSKSLPLGKMIYSQIFPKTPICLLIILNKPTKTELHLYVMRNSQTKLRLLSQGTLQIPTGTCTCTGRFSLLI